jgi:hypothetical protein
MSLPRKHLHLANILAMDQPAGEGGFVAKKILTIIRLANIFAISFK